MSPTSLPRRRTSRYDTAVAQRNSPSEQAKLPEFRGEVVRVQRNPRWMALGALPFLAVPVLITLAIVTRQPAVAVPSLHATILGAVAMAWLYRANKNPVFKTGELFVDREGVHHKGRLIARRSEIRAAFTAHREGAVEVRLERRGLKPSIVLRVADDAEARRVMLAVGMDASQTVAEVRAASQIFAWSILKQICVFVLPLIGAGMMGAVTAAAGVVFVTPLLVPLMVISMFVLLFSRTHLRIGADGVGTKWLGQQHFYPFAQMQDAASYEERIGGKTQLGVRLSMTNGDQAKIPCGQKGWNNVDPSEIEQRIREARDVHRRGGWELDPQLLARGERTVADWLVALRAVGAGAGADMRTSAIPTDRLLSLIADASAPGIARVAASIAALEQAPEEARTRARIAAVTTAEPTLRKSFERVASASSDDDALAEALAELEAEEPNLVSRRAF